MDLADYLHDGPLQELIAARRLLEAADGGSHRGEDVAAAREVLLSATHALRGTVASLHPHVLSELGLEAALRELAGQLHTRDGLRVTVSIEALPELSEEQAFLLYAAARELLVNVVKHAAATGVQITLAADADDLRLAVVDDGVGIADDQLALGRHVRSGHIGLASQSLRLTSAGGGLTLSPVLPHGTAARVRLPLG
jgi:two-component system, NarL family, sensor kinase